MIIVAGTPLKSLFDLVADRPAAPASDEARDYAARVETAREELEVSHGSHLELTRSARAPACGVRHRSEVPGFPRKDPGERA